MNDGIENIRKNLTSNLLVEIEKLLGYCGTCNRGVIMIQNDELSAPEPDRECPCQGVKYQIMGKVNEYLDDFILKIRINELDIQFPKTLDYKFTRQQGENVTKRINYLESLINENHS